MPRNRHEWIVIGISGVTCGGKTTLSNKLLSTLTPVHVFHQDKYFFPDDSPRHVRCQGLDHNNYDILSALDMPRMYRDVIETIGGHALSHASHEVNDPGRLRVEGKKFLIVEGFTALNYRPLLELCNFRYYFVLEYAECLARRVFRLYDPPDVDGYFDLCVWPEHLRYRAEMEKDPRVKLLDGMRPDAFDLVISDLKALGAREIPEPTGPADE